MCKQQHRCTWNPFLNGTKDGDVDGTYRPSLKVPLYKSESEVTPDGFIKNQI